VRSSLLGSTLREGLALRTRPGDPQEPVSRAAYRTVSRAFVRAVEAAQGSLRAAGQPEEAANLDEVTWHALRHTFASRLVAAGVDLRSVEELGGWRTLSMVQRYAHHRRGT
jgi:integrase